MDPETLKILMMRNLIRVAREKYNFPKADADCKLEPGQWGTDMNSMGQVFAFSLELRESNRTVELAGNVCLTEWPGTDKPPQVTGSTGEWKFEFFL